MKKQIFILAILFGINGTSVAANMCMITDTFKPEPKTVEYKGNNITCSDCYFEDGILMVPPGEEIIVERKNNLKVKWRFINSKDHSASVERVMNVSPRRSVLPTLTIPSE